jgi:hypothetical protein
MQRGRLERLAPLSGVLFFLLIAAAIIVFPDETPSVDDSRAKVVKFWLEHDSDAVASSIIFALAAIPLVWFAGTLRAASRAAEESEGRLSATAFAGAIILAAAIVIGATMQFVLGDAADDLPPVAIQTLSAASSDFFFPFLVGIFLWLSATGLVILRHGVLHAAFGWLALLVAIVAITPIGFVGFIASPVWVLAVSIALYRRWNAPPTGPATTPTAPATSPGSPA